MARSLPSAPQPARFWSGDVGGLATLCLGATAALLASMSTQLAVLLLVPLFVLHRIILLRHVAHAAATDETTGLLTAAAWRQLASRELTTIRRLGGSVGLLMIDLDHVRQVDDGYRQRHGDEVLRAVAQVLRDVTPRSDLVARSGEDEFVLLLPGAGITATMQVAQQVQAGVQEIAFAGRVDDGPAIVDRLSVSIGAAVHPSDGRTLDDLLLAADNLLFAAKDDGRGDVRFTRVLSASRLHRPDVGCT